MAVERVEFGVQEMTLSRISQGHSLSVRIDAIKSYTLTAQANTNYSRDGAGLLGHIAYDDPIWQFGAIVSDLPDDLLQQFYEPTIPDASLLAFSRVFPLLSDVRIRVATAKLDGRLSYTYQMDLASFEIVKTHSGTEKTFHEWQLSGIVADSGILRQGLNPGGV